jgi:lysophospholipase L1-like esterase
LSLLRPFAVSLAIALAVLGLAEAGLRVLGFEREASPVVFRFGYPNPREMTGLFRTDPRLFWRFRPGTVFDAEAPVPINGRGYRGPEPADPRPPGLVRIVVLGDSVAFGSATAWPEVLAENLGRSLPDREVEVLNFGVPGYSVVQGLRQFEDEVAPLAPDLVLVAYGWNDHWIARGGLPDADRDPRALEESRLALALARLRLTQALHALRPRSDDGAVASSTRRVPAPDFEEYVARLLEASVSAGAVPVVIELPSALTERDVPGYLVDQGFTPSSRDAVADHARYAALAREAAERAAAPWVGTAEAFAPGGVPDTSLFTADRIHLSAAGHALLASLVEREVLESRQLSVEAPR